MNLAVSIPDKSFTTRDFVALGRKYDIRYCFPEAGQSSNRVVLRGKVCERTLATGLHLTLSDVQVLCPYESLSTGKSPLFICCVLEGKLGLRIGRQHYELDAGMVLSLSLKHTEPVTVFHQAGQHLRTLTLASPEEQPTQALFSALLEQLKPQQSPYLWRLIPELHQQLNQLRVGTHLSTAENLMLEGMALQLLSQHAGQQTGPTVQTGKKLSPAEYSRLYALHAQIIEAPEAPYNLHELAQQIAMSGSSLRNKFRDLFDESLFDFIRRQRLLKAHALLSCGHSIERTAYECGYRHASNFTTAFKRQFGYSPGSLLRSA